LKILAGLVASQLVVGGALFRSLSVW
jgi:hypothetical protein